MDDREFWRPNSAAITALRAAKGWSRSKLAIVANVSPHTAGKIERGEPVFPATLAAVAAALAVPPEELRAGSEAVLRMTAEQQRILQVTRDWHDAYERVAGPGEVNVELFLCEFARPLAENVTYTYSAPRPVPFNGVFHGRDAAVRFVRDLVNKVRRFEFTRVDGLCMVGPRETLTRGVDSVIMEGVGRFTANWIHLAEFDEAGTIIRFHKSVDVISVEPVRHDGGSCS